MRVFDAPLGEAGLHLAIMAKAGDKQIQDLRRQLAAEIARSLGPNSQYSISPSYGIPQPRMSELNRGMVARCSAEWLIRRIHQLGGSVTVTVTLGNSARQWTLDRRAEFRRRQSGG